MMGFLKAVSRAVRSRFSALGSRGSPLACLFLIAPAAPFIALSFAIYASLTLLTPSTLVLRGVVQPTLEEHNKSVERERAQQAAMRDNGANQADVAMIVSAPPRQDAQAQPRINTDVDYRLALLRELQTLHPTVHALVDTSLMILLAVVALYFAGVTRPDHADQRMYAEIRQTIVDIEARLVAIRYRLEGGRHPDEDEQAWNVRAARAEAAYESATHFLEEAKRLLARNDVGWTLGTRYVLVLTLLRRADEVLLEVAPLEDLVRAVAFDAARVKGSPLETLWDFRELWTSALNLVDKAAFNGLAAILSGLAGGPAKNEPAHEEGRNDRLATSGRALVRSARRYINDFRLDRRARLIYLRNQCTMALFAVGVITFAIIAFALDVAYAGEMVNTDIPFRVSTEQILAVINLYLIGAVVGLLTRLYRDSRRGADDMFAEDYDMADPPVALTIALSGLAAVIGVWAIGTLNVAFNSPIRFLPTEGTGLYKGLLDWTTYPAVPMTAAVLGWAPSLLFDRFRDYADRLKLDLRQTEALPPRPEPAKAAK